MSYERQLQMRQVYSTLSLGVELIKSDINLKFRQNLMYPVTLPIEEVFKGSNNRTLPCAYATPTSNGLLENLFHFTEKTRNGNRAF